MSQFSHYGRLSLGTREHPRAVSMDKLSDTVIVDLHSTAWQPTMTYADNVGL